MAKDEKQLKQMTRYILNEAKDKAEEIMAETLQEYYEKKTRIFNAGKEKVIMDVEEKRKNELIKMKISGSGAELRNRVAKVNLQHDRMQAIALAAKEKLVSVCEGDQKQELLKKFIVQGCLMLLEPEVTVICRAADQEAVSAIKDDAEQEYTNQIQTQINKHSGGSVSDIQRTVKLTVQTFSSEFDFYSAGDNCIGGVVLQTGGNNPAVKGKITIDNTLNARLDQVMEKAKPQIRKQIGWKVEKEKK